MALQAYKEIMEMLESQSFEIKAFSFGVNLDQLFQLGAYGGQTVAVPVKDSARDGRKVSVRARRRFVASELDGTTSQQYRMPGSPRSPRSVLEHETMYSGPHVPNLAKYIEQAAGRGVHGAVNLHQS